MILSVKAGLAVMAVATTLAASACGQNDAPVQSRDKTGARALYP